MLIRSRLLLPLRAFGGTCVIGASSTNRVSRPSPTTSHATRRDNSTQRHLPIRNHQSQAHIPVCVNPIAWKVDSRYCCAPNLEAHFATRQRLAPANNDMLGQAFMLQRSRIQALKFRKMESSQCLVLHTLHADRRSVSYNTVAVIPVSGFFFATREDEYHTKRADAATILSPCSNLGLMCAIYEGSVQS